jgi:hypothetical protein
MLNRKSIRAMAIGAVAVVLMLPLSAQAGPGGRTCNLPESNAESLEILSNYYPGYWWDHTNLTVAVQAHPKATEQQLEAIHDAIATWDEVLRDCFDGLITLTDVTGTQPSEQKAADIVIHYVPHAGGVVFGGYAICGDHGCPNILVRSDLPPSLDREPYEPEYLGWVTLHELGHALGLGHATNLLESTDLWVMAGRILATRSCRTATSMRSRLSLPGCWRAASRIRPQRVHTTAPWTEVRRRLQPLVSLASV